MSDITATPATEQFDDNYIPDAADVATPNAGGTWRISSGVIQRGREEESNLETIDKIVGRLRRFGIQGGKGNNDKPYLYLEATIETAQGPQHVHTALLNTAGELAPSASCVSFAEGLLDLAKDELMILTARQSTKKNAFNTYSTYANLFHLKAGEQRGVATKRREWPKDTKFAEMWPVLEKELRVHPAYSERVAEAAASGPTHLSELIKLCDARGWPSPSAVPGVWLNRIATMTKEPAKASLTEHSDEDIWGPVRQAITAATECPDWLKAQPKQEALI